MGVFSLNTTAKEPHSSVLALCDFNGTIVDADMIKALAAGAGAAASPFEPGTREDIEHYARQLSFDRSEAENHIEAAVNFDSSFVPFERACFAAGVLLIVITSGVRELVERYLQRRNVSVPVFSNDADISRDGWRMRFRDDSPAGIDKAAFALAALRDGRKVAVIGDDRSDFEAALAASIVFAKRSSPLDHFLHDRRRKVRTFSTFTEILKRWPPSTRHSI